MGEASFYAVFRRVRFPSGRCIRKYVSRDGGNTEDKMRRKLWTDRNEAMAWASRLDQSTGYDWQVAPVKLAQDDAGLWKEVARG